MNRYLESFIKKDLKDKVLILYLKGNDTFAKRWRRVHIDTIIREDLLDLERVPQGYGI